MTLRNDFDSLTLEVIREFVTSRRDEDLPFATYSPPLDQSMAPAFARVSKNDLTLWLAGPQSSAARPMPDGRCPEPGGWVVLGHRAFGEGGHRLVFLFVLASLSTPGRRDAGVAIGPRRWSIFFEDEPSFSFKFFDGTKDPARHSAQWTRVGSAFPGVSVDSDTKEALEAVRVDLRGIESRLDSKITSVESRLITLDAKVETMRKS